MNIKLADKFKRVSYASMLLLVFYLLRSFVSVFARSSFAGHFGAGAESDAYFAAFTIPKQLGDFLIGGVVFAIVVPVFLERKAKAGNDQALLDISVLLNLAFLILLILTLGYALAVPWIVPYLFSGFTPLTLELTAGLSVLFAPAILLMGMSLIYTALYHAHKDFVIPSLTALFFPLSTILSIWILPQEWGIERVVWGNLLGVFAGLLILCLRIRDRIKWHWHWDLGNPLLQKVLLLSYPVLLAQLIGKVIPLVQKSAASQLAPGSVSGLEYSFFLINSVILIVLGPLGTAVFPLLSEQKSSENIHLLSKTFNQALRTIVFLVVPLVALLLLQSREIIELIFGYGRFSHQDVILCSGLLMVLSVAVIPCCLSNMFFKIFMVYQIETLALSITGTVIALLIMPLYFVASDLWGIRGIAAVFVLLKLESTLLIMFFFRCKLKRRKQSFSYIPLFKGLLQIGLAGVAMFVCGLFFSSFIAFADLAIVRLVFVGLAGCSIYLLAAYWLGIDEFFLILKRLPFVETLIKRF